MGKYLIETFREKCTGCNKCIRSCPVEGANLSIMENGRNIVDINNERCIGCGKCIEVCEPEARIFNDDTPEFFDALKNKRKMTLVVAPAIKVMKFTIKIQTITLIIMLLLRSLYSI